MSRSLGAAVTALALAALAAAAPAAPAQTTPRPVYVIGDSVMLGAQEAVVAALAPTPATVDAQESRSLLGAISLLQQHRAEMGDVVVVALGTNDGTDPVEFAHRIDLAMGVLEGVPHVLWVNQRDFEPGRAELNAQLVAATARYPTLRVLDWNAVVDANPGDVGPDGIHLTEPGKAAMATLVADGVREALAPPPPTTTTPPPAPATAHRAPVTVAHARQRTPSHSGSGALASGLVVAGAAPVGAVLLGAGALLLARRRRAVLPFH